MRTERKKGKSGAAWRKGQSNAGENSVAGRCGRGVRYGRPSPAGKRE